MISKLKGHRYFAALFALTSVLCAAPASAAIWCSGKLAGVYINSTGDVIINGSWRNDWTRICNLKEDTPGAVTCSLWASYAASAWQGNRNVRLMYSGPASCGEIPNYNGAPVPEYLMLEGQ
jgi:hypothetical protein